MRILLFCLVISAFVLGVGGYLHLKVGLGQKAQNVLEAIGIATNVVALGLLFYIII